MAPVVQLGRLLKRELATLPTPQSGSRVNQRIRLSRLLLGCIGGLHYSAASSAPSSLDFFTGAAPCFFASTGFRNLPV
jgi:hypothetical protein